MKFQFNICFFFENKLSVKLIDIILIYVLSFMLFFEDALLRVCNFERVYRLIVIIEDSTYYFKGYRFSCVKLLNLMKLFVPNFINSYIEDL